VDKGLSVLIEPEELELYPFLTGQRREIVDKFLTNLESPFRAFALKRYSERKTISQIAEEMGYSERNLFRFRKRILLCWYYHQDQRIS